MTLTRLINAVDDHCTCAVLVGDLGLTTPATAALPDFCQRRWGSRQRIPMFRFGMTVDGPESRVVLRIADLRRLSLASPRQGHTGNWRLGV